MSTDDVCHWMNTFNSLGHVFIVARALLSRTRDDRFGNNDNFDRSLNNSNSVNKETRYRPINAVVKALSASSFECLYFSQKDQK